MYYVYLENVIHPPKEICIMFIWKMLILLGKYVLCLFRKCYATFRANMYYVYLENVIHLGKYVLCPFGKCYTFREICIMFIWKMLYI